MCFRASQTAGWTSATKGDDEGEAEEVRLLSCDSALKSHSNCYSLRSMMATTT